MLYVLAQGCAFQVQYVRHHGKIDDVEFVCAEVWRIETTARQGAKEGCIF